MNAHTILVEFTLRDATLARFSELVHANAAASLKNEPGCRRFDVFVPDGANRVVLYEEYRDREAFAAHCRTPHFHAFDAAVASMIVTKQVTVLAPPIVKDSPPAATPTAAAEHSVPAADLLALGVDVFMRAGVPADEAEIVANALVEADLRGMQSHGVLRIPIYVEKIRANGFRAGRKGTIVHESSGTALLDGEDGLGQAISLRAMDSGRFTFRRVATRAWTTPTSTTLSPARSLRSIIASIRSTLTISRPVRRRVCTR